MAWQTTAPNGNLSVAANRSILQDNTTYIKTTMNLDHSWDTDANLDGHHLFTKMPKVDVDPTLTTDLDLVYYAREKTAAESPENEDVQPFVKNADSAIMQLLGIRVCAVINMIGTTPTTVYSHNLTSVTRSSTGAYTVTFPALPSDNYLVYCGLVSNSSNPSGLGYMSIAGSTDQSTKTTTTVELRAFTFSGSPSAIDPLQFWFVIFGG